ncbi:MAG: restriction endonuclease subunit S [Elusimicrobia bacterium]|nr:restriction endonuclease subunit S [Elusimicrobiota bacterium]
MPINQISSLRMGNKFKKTSIGEIPVEWEVSRLGDIVGMYSGGTPSRNCPQYFGGGIPWVKSGELNPGYVFKTEETITEEGLNSSSAKWVPANSVLLALYGATAGQIALLKIKATINQAVLAIIPKEEAAWTPFLYYSLRSQIEKLISITQGSGQPNLNQEVVSSLELAIPPINEQMKIAEILSSVDDAIEKADVVIAKTHDLKKALMQRFFTRGIDHTKFKKTPIGEIPVEWETNQLGTLLNVLYRYPTYFNIKYTSSGVPEIRGEFLKSNGKIESDLIRYRFISPETAGKFSKTKLETGDLVLSVRGTLGKVGIVPESLKGATITANLIRMSPNQNLVSSEWLLAFLMSEGFKDALEQASSSTTIKTVTAPELKNIAIGLPPLAEQKKISEILSSVDDAIEKSESERDHLEQTKKSLMADLLTGRVRTV